MGKIIVDIHGRELNTTKTIINGKEIEIDEEGYLTDLRVWTQEVCNKLAELDKLVLTKNHWELINFLREYYEEYQCTPAVRVITKAVRKKLGPDKGNSEYLYELFPNGGMQACRIAGLPRPTC